VGYSEVTAATSADDPSLARARRLDHPERGPDQFHSCDDKGLTDFSFLAMTLFGQRLNSLYYMFFLLLSFSVALFAVAFFRSPAKMALLVLWTGSLYATVHVIGIDDQFANLHEPRFFDILSFLPLLHLLLVGLEGRFTPQVALTALAQVVLLVFVYHVRATAGWQIVCLVAWCPVACWLLARRRVSTAPVVGGWFRAALLACWPISLVLLGLGGLHAYKHTMYHPRYFQDIGSEHVFWHNTVMGLSLHPRLAQTYQIDIDDEKIMEATERYLREDGQEVRRQAIFCRKDYARDPCAPLASIDWVTYDLAVRDMFLDACRKFPVEVAVTHLFYKPMLLVKQFCWAIGLDPPDVVAAARRRGHTLAAPEVRRARRLYYNPFRLRHLFAVLACLLLAGTALVQEGRSLLLVSTFVFAFSLLPVLVVYPLLHVLGTVFVATTLLLYTGLVLALGRLTAGFPPGRLFG
jgi:hypothetical protein